jgi:hypothetical protein
MRSLRSPLLAVVLVACQSQKAGVAPGPEKPSAGETLPTAAQRYEASGVVIDKEGVGPQLCLSGEFLSNPPQCSGLPLVGWDWAKAKGETTLSGTKWGEYRVVGTYDGKRMTLTEPPGPPRYAKGYQSKFDTPCREPTGGWARPDPMKTTTADLIKVSEAAQKVPDFAGLWLTNLDPLPPNADHQDMKEVVVNVTFTGDLARRRAELRKLWGGVLCVAQKKHSLAELMAIRTEAQAMIRELGLGPRASDLDEIRGKILVDVTTMTAEQQAKLDEKFGALLVVTALLRPVP